jgi:hypothetical protein
MGRSRRSGLIALPCLTLLGCSLLFDPEAYEGPDAGRGVDAARPLDAETRMDVGRDARDAGETPDAKEADARPDAAHFCQGIDAAFCADFDEGELLLGWTASPTPLHSFSSGNLELDDSIAKSKPASLLASLPELSPDAGGSGNEEFLEDDLATGWREVTLDFDLNIGTIASGGGMSVLSFEFLGETTVGIQMGIGASKVTDAGTLGSLDFSTLTGPDPSDWLYDSYDYQPGKWFHVTFDVLPATSGGKVNVSFDGVPVQAWMGIDFAADPMAADLRLQLGLSQYGTFTPAVEINYDNVVIRYP